MRDILEMLAGGGFVSGEKISAELGISRAAVWKRVEALRAQGYAIESAGRRGYRLVPGDALDPSLWKGALTTRELGRGEVRYQAEVSSTNTVLKEMAVGGAPQGSLCLCDRQTAGRGRLGRQWISPAGQGLWCSTLLRPRLKPEDAPFITFCTAMALAEAIDRLCGTQARIKWPNDVVIQGKKCCSSPARIRRSSRIVPFPWRNSRIVPPCAGRCSVPIWPRWSLWWIPWKPPAFPRFSLPIRRAAVPWAAGCRSAAAWS